MTVRPLASFDFGPVGLRGRQYFEDRLLSVGGVGVPDDDRPFLDLNFLEGCLSGNQGFRSPLIDKLVDFL